MRAFMPPFEADAQTKTIFWKEKKHSNEEELEE